MISAVATVSSNPKLSGSRPSEGLGAIADNKDGRYSAEQQSDAFEKLNVQEYAAFGHLSGSGSSWGMRDQMKAYVKYVEGLSPEDQQSDRYRGTLGSVKSMISQFDAYIRDNNIPDIRKGGGGDAAKIPDSPIVKMLKESAEALAKTVDDRTKAREDAKTAASASTPVNVTLSTAALEILQAPSSEDRDGD
jgi:hypothetical protein